MNIRYFLFLTLIIISQSLSSQNLEWALKIGSLGRDQVGDISTDQNGNILATGRFQGLVDFDYGPGVTALQSNGGSDIFVAKYSPSGNFIWASSFGGSSTVDLGRGVLSDPSGNTYVTGFFEGQVDFDPSPATANRTANGEDAFLVKFNSIGIFQWVLILGGSGDEEPRTLKMDNAGNLFVSGYFSSSFTYQFQGNNTSLSSSGSDDAFMTKINPNGQVIWAKKFGGSGRDLIASSGFDASNNYYVTGDFSNTVDFDPGTSITQRSSNGGVDFFIARYDTSGQLGWVRTLGGLGNDHVTCLDLNGAFQLNVGGYYESSNVDFDPGSGVTLRSSAGDDDGFALSLTTSGNYRWVRSFGGTSKDVVGGIISDKWGHVFTTGYYVSSNVNFNPGGTAQTLSNTGFSDAFLLKLDSNNNFEWLGHFSGSNYVVGNRFAFAGPNNLVIGGSFEGTADFDPTTSSLNLGSNGGRDFYLVNIDLCEISYDSLSFSSCSPVLSPSGRYVWNSSGIYYDTLTNVVGCDSVLYFDLTIGSDQNVFLTDSSCGPYTSPSGNNVWTSSGIYLDTLSTSLGCDSILTIDLKVGSASTSSFSVSSCNQYVAPSGKIINSNGLFFDTIPNNSGCDSVMTIFLTLNTNSTFTQNVTACNQYVSPSNKIYTTSGTYLDTIPNAQSCDSIITTQLTIQSLNLQLIQIGNQLISAQNGAKYQWLDCGANFSPLPNDTNQSFTPLVSGDYAVALDNGSCVDTTACFNVIITSLNESELARDLKLYPNPARDRVFIDTEVKINRVVLIDNNGRSHQAEIKNNRRVDLNNFSNGLYFLQVETVEGVLRKKLLITK